MKICIIDDDFIYRYTVQKALTSQAIASATDLMSFENGEDAINYFKAHSSINTDLPDCVLLDINMPLCDGWQFLDLYRNIKPTLSKEFAIYMVSSSIDRTDIQKLQNYPEVLRYLTKPIHAQELKSLFS